MPQVRQMKGKTAQLDSSRAQLGVREREIVDLLVFLYRICAIQFAKRDTPTAKIMRMRTREIPEDDKKLRLSELEENKEKK
jgi:hypothetical protein